MHDWSKSQLTQYNNIYVIRITIYKRGLSRASQAGGRMDERGRLLNSEGTADMAVVAAVRFMPWSHPDTTTDC